MEVGRVRRFGMIMGALALLAVLAAGIGGWVLRAQYVADKLSKVTDPPDLPVGPTPVSAASEAGAPRVLILGDSRVRQWSPAPGRTGALFFLRGAGGETSAGAAKRIREEVARLRPDIVVVMTGVNDLVAASLNPDEAPAVERGLVDNLLTMAAAAKEGGATPVIATVVPPAEPGWARGIFVWSDRIWEATWNANTEIARRAQEESIRVVDLAAAVGADATPLASTYSEDTLHWNGTMYGRLNELLSKGLFGK